MARLGIAALAVVGGGIGTLVTASAAQVISTLPLCAMAGSPNSAAPCTSGPNPAGSTDVLDQATVDATGDESVAFTLWAPGSCGTGAQPLFRTVAPVGGPAAVHQATITGAEYSVVSAGVYDWTAEILRGTTVGSGPTACGDETVDIIKASPELGTTAAGAVVGGTLADTAQLTHGATLGGTANFALFAPADASCSGTPLHTWADVPLSGGRATTVPAFTAIAVGTYHWTVSYSGDASDNPAASACTSEPAAVRAASPVLHAAASAGGRSPVSLGDTVALVGAYRPAGSVTFRLYAPADVSCSGAAIFTDTETLAPGATSVASRTVRVTGAGTYRWTATFTSTTPDDTGAASACGAAAATVTAALASATSPATSPLASGVQASTTTPETGGASGLTGLGLLVVGAGALLITCAIALGLTSRRERDGLSGGWVPGE